MKKLISILSFGTLLLVYSAPSLSEDIDQLLDDDIDEQKSQAVKDFFNDLDLDLIDSTITNNIDKTQRKLTYEKAKTYHLTTNIFHDLIIQLPLGETIVDYTFKNKKFFTVATLVGSNKLPSNRIRITASANGVASNLSVAGKTGRIYTFYITSHNTRDEIPIFTASFVDDFREPFRRKKPVDDKDYLTELKTYLVHGFDIEVIKRINSNYKVVKNNMGFEVHVFDDGIFTYFFLQSDSDSYHFTGIDVPVIYESKGGYDYMVQTQKLPEKNMIVVKKTAGAFTLRSGTVMGNETTTLLGMTYTNDENTACIRKF